MVYLFLGDQADVKHSHITKIKDKFLTSSEARHFDYQLLYGDKLDKDTLKKALLDLPASAEAKVVVIKSIEKLKADHKKIITAFLDEQIKTTVLVLDSDKADAKNAFIARLRKEADEVKTFGGDKKESVWDMTNAIKRAQPRGALKTLDQLLNGGESPVKILGALIWFWGKTKDGLSKRKFEKGLEFLQETDLNIKRSRLSPDYALEKLVISLSALLA